ncbi:TMV resistance protein N-like [Rutidosis leptorrhynchoides]|uniref:TMV resistance protein N-like n=1 Tax=Rutidosis leptorrhynchoides TaxID=125765 RepID=UPI003A99BFCD
MASSSSSTGSRKYDVFLSFRGEDTRKNYVDHLYTALSGQLIYSYKDDQTLPRGDSIGPSLLNAIEESQIAVIVFSENYADSSWCLDELVHIMKSREERKLIVLPVFYKVSPSDVRKLQGNFGRAFAKRKRDNSAKEELWKTAIVEACNVSGWEPSHIANGLFSISLSSFCFYQNIKYFTTRDEHLLHKDKVKISHASLLLDDEAFQLFNRHAVQKEKPRIEDYDTLSRRVISYADGLPLALKVLGSLLRGKDKKPWESVLDKMKNIPNPKIMDVLKISYDGLEPIERELFLDIACFHRRKPVDKAKEIFDACGFYPDSGIQVLRQKALITISDGCFEMHDLVQEMGHYIVRGLHPKNPEKHSRVWKYNEIVEMCSTDSTVKENDKIEAISFNGCSSGFSKLVSNMKELRLLLVHATECAHDYSDQNVEWPSFLSNELHYISYNNYPGSLFPADFQPTKLVVLKLRYTLQKELWQSYKRLPQLKKLTIKHADNLVSTPILMDFHVLNI